MKPTRDQELRYYNMSKAERIEFRNERLMCVQKLLTEMNADELHETEVVSNVCKKLTHYIFFAFIGTTIADYLIDFVFLLPSLWSLMTTIGFYLFAAYLSYRKIMQIVLFNQELAQIYRNKGWLTRYRDI